MEELSFSPPPHAASASGKGWDVGRGAPPLHSLLREAGDSSYFQLPVSLHVGGHFLAHYPHFFMSG